MSQVTVLQASSWIMAILFILGTWLGVRDHAYGFTAVWVLLNLTSLRVMRRAIQRRKQQIRL
jgi:hypothetical protein